MSFPSVVAWMDLAEEAADEIARSLLGAGVERMGRQATPSLGLVGAYVPVMANGECIQVGWLASEEGCQVMGRRFLAMEESAPLAPGEVADVFGELVNILAGQMKTRVSRTNPLPLTLGLPLFIHGVLERSGSMEVSVSNLRQAQIDCALVVVGPRPGGGEPAGKSRSQSLRPLHA